MKSRAINPAARLAASVVSGAVVIGAFGFLFLAKAPVKGVEDLYVGLHLDGVMTLDDLFGLGHVAVYATLAAIFGLFTRTVGGWMTIFLSLAALGFAVEVFQGLGGIRSFGLDDMLANLIGICVGFFVVAAMGQPRTRRNPARRR